MRTKKTPHILFVVFACLLSACVAPDIYNGDPDPGDPDPDPNEPTKGVMVINSDWNNRSTGISIPSTFTVELGSNKVTFSSQQTQYPDSIDPGMYSLRLYNTATGVDVSGSMASLTSPNGTTVSPTPGWFFASSSQSVTIVVGETTSVDVPMKQFIKQLTITVEVEDGGASRIDYIVGSLSGVAGAVDMNSGTVQNAMTTNNFLFTKSGDNFVATLNLMGIVGTTQNITVTPTLLNGATLEPFVSNVYSQLSTFNNNMIETAGLTNSITLGVNPEVTATIDEWEAIEGEDIKIGY